MKYKLNGQRNLNYSTIEQILVNRGIKFEDIHHYLNTTDDDINDYLLLGEEKLRNAGWLIKAAMQEEMKIFMPVDSDMDGYTSAALFINYLCDIFGDERVKRLVTWKHHSGKQHGLKDMMDDALKADLVICLDAGSNDYGEHYRLRNAGIPIIIIDHHEVDVESQDAIVINNQICEYPNKALSGVGVTWQFCRYLDENIFNKNYHKKYFDLLAVGLNQLG